MLDGVAVREGDYVRVFGVREDGQEQYNPDGLVGVLTKMYPSWWWEVMVNGRALLVYHGNLRKIPDLEVLMEQTAGV